MDFTPKGEDKMIINTVSHKLYRPLGNPPNKVWIYKKNWN